MSHQPKNFLAQLFEYLHTFHPLSEGLIEAYNKQCTLKLVKKNKFILSPIDHNESLYFLTKGFVRGFVKEQGKDITTWFSTGGEIIGAIRHPEGEENYSIEHLQALEDSELIVIPYSLIDMMYQKFPEGNIISRKVLSLKYFAASQRAILSRIPNAADRYDRLIESGNLDLNRIPIRYLSSYLGIRIETLSRIRAKKLNPMPIADLQQIIKA